MGPSLSAFMNLPPSLRILFVVLGGGSLCALIGFLPKWIRLPLLIGLAVVALILLAYRRLLKKLNKRKAAPLERGISKNAAATPQAVTEASRRAAMEDLRKNFQKGIETFRAAGKNLYSLPWYLIGGEPGSGKTEAIRHSSIGFPPGLHDPLQGAGGTINMNWWFTNHAVVLDTAGRLMFEEVEYGAPSEWGEFLKLLNSHRRNCPVNGLLLVIPADSLIMDTADAIQRKGQKIAHQLDHIQRTLGVRFPVFVVVTKCDLIYGFREFFDNIDDPELQHQILGWSNPALLDEQFKPELVDQHLRSVMDRLERRRLALLIDPVPTGGASARRTDEVDALYAFPRSLARIIPRLRRYLEMVFVAGEWSPKPLFLRGIYFTSSMREGSALDEELAEVLGVPVTSLPEGRVWERERSYFLRDLFTNKVFREKGLVTRATHAKRQHHRRKAAVLGAGFASAVLFALLTLIGVHDFKKRIGDHSNYYVRASEVISDSEGFQIVRRESDGSYSYNAGKRKDKKKPSPLCEFHSRGLELAKKEITVPRIFRPWIRGENLLRDKRLVAQEKLYRLSVLHPLVDAAREKMKKETADTWSADAARAPAQKMGREAEGEGSSGDATPGKALAQLIRLEAYREKLQTTAIVESEKGEFFNLDDLFNYVLKESDRRVYEKDSAGLKKCQNETYGPRLEQAWPPQGIPLDSAYTEGRPIHTGVRAFTGFWSFEALAKRDPRLGEAPGLDKALEDYRVAEEGFLETRGDGEELKQARGKLKEAKEKLDLAVHVLDDEKAKGVLIKAVREAKGKAEEAYKILLEETEIEEGEDNEGVVAHAHKKLETAKEQLESEFAKATGLLEQAGDYGDLLAKLDTHRKRRSYEYRYDTCMLESAQEVAGEIARLAKGNGYKPATYPVIPLTNMQGKKTFEERYQPKAATEYLSDWKTLDEKHKEKLSKKLLTKYDDGLRKAIGGYVKEYVIYWHPTQLPETGGKPSWRRDLQIVAEGDWNGTHDKISALVIQDVRAQLESLRNTLSAAFSQEMQRIVSHFGEDKDRRRFQEAQDALKEIQTETFRDEQYMLGAWKNLDDEAVKAREALLGQTPDGLRDNYFRFEAKRSQKLAAMYWADLASVALDSLAHDPTLSKNIPKLLDELADKYGKFPLVRLDEHPDREDYLTAEAVRQARQPVNTVLPAERVPKIGSDKIDKELERLLNLDIRKQDLDWVAKLKGFLDDLGAGGRCTVSISGDSLLRFYRHVGVRQGTQFKRVNTEEARGFRTLLYPSSDDVVFSFYEHPTDEQPSLELTIPGPWACLVMLHGPKLSIKQGARNIPATLSSESTIQGKTWRIKLDLPKPSEKEGPPGPREAEKPPQATIELEFDKKLPTIGDWPSRRPGP